MRLRTPSPAFCLYLLLANSVITNTALVQLTLPGIATSLRVLLFILLNGIVLTTAIYAIFLNDVIERTKNEGMIDSLSGAFNRRFYAKMTEQPQSSPKGCVVMCDIDNFKKINDTHGHHVGDLVIQQFTGLLRTALRPNDSVIRLGGEEFLLVLIDTHIEQVHLITQRLCHHIAGTEVNGHLNPIRFTASFGVAEITEQGIEQAVQHADLLLYQAKKCGKNQVAAELCHVADPSASLAQRSIQ